LSEAVALEPEAEGCHYLLAQSLEALGDLPGAEAESRRAIELRPLDDANQYLLGRLLVLQKRAAEALPVLETAVRLRADEPYNHTGLGWRSRIRAKSRRRSRTSFGPDGLPADPNNERRIAELQLELGTPARPRKRCAGPGPAW
jgi:tetratricopeptide (TPR) repeat protein